MQKLPLRPKAFSQLRVDAVGQVAAAPITQRGEVHPNLVDYQRFLNAGHATVHCSQRQ
jgi:hypothetical protein